MVEILSQFIIKNVVLKEDNFLEGKQKNEKWNYFAR